MKKTKRINFWLGDKDLAMIDRKAKKMNLSRSAYIRKMLFEAEIIPSPDIDYSYYENEFRRLGYSLNDIVREYHTFGFLDSKAADRVWNKLSVLAEQLRSELVKKTIDLEVTHYGKQER